MRSKWDTLVLGGLTVATGILALALVWEGGATWLEAVAFVTGAVCVWLTVKESVWNFPISLVNVAVFCVVFFRARLFADGSLQVVYFVLTVMGWYLWVRGGERRTALRISKSSAREMMAVWIAVAVMTVGLWGVLRMVNGTATFWDALTTAISLGAQWLLNYKKLQNWVLWIVADLVYVPLYAWKGLYLTAVLYGVFLVMATMGYWEWRATWRKERAG
jgi:nicotinamide mononucleotide transporter